MPDAASHEVKQTSSSADQILHWASCHPGVLLFGSLVLAALLTEPRAVQPNPLERRPETEADLIDGEDPLFI